MPVARVPAGGARSVAAVDGPAAPQLGEARGVGLAPQGDPPGLLGLVVEVSLDARGFDPPARRCADLHPAKAPVEHERDDLVDGEGQHLRDLSRREQAHPGRGCFGHEAIIVAPARIRLQGRDLWITSARPCALRDHGRMTDHSAARPRPRAFWTDVRFLIGIALVVASVAGVWFVVAAARQTVAVFAAARTIVPGETVDADDLRVVEVGLGRLQEAYASPATLLPGAVATRTIAAGELVPQDAVADAASLRTTNVVVHSATEIPASVRAGTTVEVWAAPQLARGEFDTPRILVAGATVVSVAADDSMMGSNGTAVELVIGRADVADTLAAVAGGARVSIIPTAGEAP